MTDFFETEMRVGEIIKAEIFKEAKKPAYKLWINFGEELGVVGTCCCSCCNLDGVPRSEVWVFLQVCTLRPCKFVSARFN